MILCKANSLSTTALPRRAVASKTFKEQSKRKTWSFTTKYGQCYLSFYNISIFTYLSQLQAYNGGKNKRPSEYFSQNFGPNLALCNDLLIQAKLPALMYL